MYGVTLYKDGCYWKIWANGCIVFKSRSSKAAHKFFDGLKPEEYNKWAHGENQRLLSINQLD